MLVLTRKTQESIVLPGLNIKVTVVEIDGNRVKIGIEAPPEVDIFRAELLDGDNNHEEVVE